MPHRQNTRARPEAAPRCAAGGYVCAAAALRSEVATGWLVERAIAAATSPVDPAPPLAAWTGTWRYFDNRIVLSQTGNAISASGEAYWPGRNVMPANEGGFAGAASPSGARLHIGAADPVDCDVEMVLAGPFLVVTDNRNCGGHNVSFRGIYVRRARAR